MGAFLFAPPPRVISGATLYFWGSFWLSVFRLRVTRLYLQHLALPHAGVPHHQDVGVPPNRDAVLVRVFLSTSKQHQGQSGLHQLGHTHNIHTHTQRRPEDRKHPRLPGVWRNISICNFWWKGCWGGLSLVGRSESRWGGGSESRWRRATHQLSVDDGTQRAESREKTRVTSPKLIIIINIMNIIINISLHDEPQQVRLGLDLLDGVQLLQGELLPPTAVFKRPPWPLSQLGPLT